MIAPNFHVINEGIQQCTNFGYIINAVRHPTMQTNFGDRNDASSKNDIKTYESS